MRKQTCVAPACLILLLTSVVRADFPDRPAAQALNGNIQFFDVSLQGDGAGQTMKLWLYLPAGTHAAKSLPCVFVAPAGSILITGMTLGDGDRAEHLPYVLAGFAVVAYELDGAMVGRTNGAVWAAVPKFMAAHGGIDNEHTAVDYVLARVPEVDPRRLYAAGHSSAATVALDVTAADPRIKACCAYAPVPNLRNRLKPTTITVLDRKVPGFDSFIDAISPVQQIEQLKTKPVMLFTADDDANVPTQSVKDFAEALQQAGAKKVKLVTVPTGGHHDSMITDGIPAGISFLLGVDSKIRK